jgi:hypothetical protein
MNARERQALYRARLWERAAVTATRRVRRLRFQCVDEEFHHPILIDAAVAGNGADLHVVALACGLRRLINCTRSGFG